MLPRLDHRYQNVLAALEAENKPQLMGVEAELYAILSGGSSSLDDLYYALDLRSSPPHAEALDGFLLVGGTPEQIADALDIHPVSAVTHYAFLFFDVTVLRNRIDRLLYAEEMSRTAVNAGIMDAVKQAINVGPDYLTWFWNPTKAGVNPVTVVRRVMTDGYYRSFAHIGNPLTDRTTQEALKLAKSSMGIAKVLEDLAPSGNMAAADAIELAIEERERTLTAEEAGVDLKQVLH